MTIRFDTLLTLGIAHGYYTAGCRDIAYIPSADTVAACQSRRLLVRVLEGQLHVLVETGPAGPLADLAGTTLRFGLKIATPVFATVTDLQLDPAAPLLLFDNSAAPTQLAAAAPARLVPPRFSHTISDAARPCTLRLTTAAGAALAQETIEDSRPTWTCLLAGRPAGLHVVEEAFPASNHTTRYYHDPEFAAAGLLAVCEIRIAPGFHAAPPHLAVPFVARDEVLSYYVIARGFQPNELAQLAVSDAGFAADARPQITFQKLTEAQLGPADLPPALLRSDDSAVLLFRSQSPVARRQAPRRRIELKRNNETLVPHLPQPAPHSATADLLIQISKH